MRNFEEILSSITDVEVCEQLYNLPIFHTTFNKYSQTIFENKKLEVVECAVLKEKALYFFYGKPNYKSSKGNVNTTTKEWNPICIILKMETISRKVSHIFPFDSGAFNANLYSTVFEGNLTLKEYDLNANTDLIKKFLSIFYISLEDYLDGNVSKKLEEKNSQQITNCYKLYTMEGDALKFDDRSRTIEIVVNNSVEINEKNIELIIAPSSLRKNVEECFKNVRVEYYNNRNLGNPHDNYGKIDYIANKYILEEWRIKNEQI